MFYRKVSENRKNELKEAFLGKLDINNPVDKEILYTTYLLGENFNQTKNFRVN